MKRLEEANGDFVGIAARHFAKPRSAVGAFDRYDVGHAVTHEGVPHVIFQIHAPDAGNLIEAMDRPAEHARRLVEFIKQRRASDVNVDRIGETDPRFAHLLRAGSDNGVIARRSGIEERHRIKAEEIIVGRCIGARIGGVGCIRRVAQKRRRIERQQYRHRTRGDICKALAGRAVELCHQLRGDARFWGLERAKLDGYRAPTDVGGSKARALHVLRGRGKDASGEREARKSESQHDAAYLAEAAAATSGRGNQQRAYFHTQRGHLPSASSFEMRLRKKNLSQKSFEEAGKLDKAEEIGGWYRGRNGSRGSCSSAAENRQRATMQTPQGLIEESITSA